MATKKTTTTGTAAAGARARQSTRARTAPAPTRARTTGRKVASTGSAPPSYQQIAEAAYFLFLQRGCAPGFDFDDWITAERDLLQRAS